jgi:hypothetical protein
MKSARVVLSLAVLSAALGSLSSGASDVPAQPPATKAQAHFSVESFDWRDSVPDLFVASTQPAEQGIKSVLEKCAVLRAYVASEVQAECASDRRHCPAETGGSLDDQISKRIDGIIRESVFHRHKSAIVDYTLTRQPFPFSEISVVKSENKPDTYLMLAFADHTYSIHDVEDKYGAPYDTDIAQWYSVFKYRLDTPQYTSRAVYEVNPSDGAVLKLAISVRPKKGH